MEQVCAAADKEVVKLYLIICPDSDSPLQWEALSAFYTRRGFCPTLERRYEWRVREPKSWVPPVYVAKSCELER